MDLNFSFEKDMEHTYLVLKETIYFDAEEKGQDYRNGMFLNNHIPGLLQAIKKERFGEEQYCYDVSRLLSLQSIYEKREIREQEFRTLLDSCIRMVKHLEEYLLDENQIIMDPEYIYIEPETGEAKFIYYPNYESDFRKGFQRLSDYLLTKIDHTQKKAVMLGYELYRFTRRSNYVLGQIEDLLVSTELEKKETDCFLMENKRDETVEESHEIAESDSFEIEPMLAQEEQLIEDNRGQTKKRAGVIGSLLMAGFMFSLVFLSRILHFYLFTRQQEMYFVAAGVMCSVVAVLFMRSMRKEKEQLEEEENENQYQFSFR